MQSHTDLAWSGWNLRYLLLERKKNNAICTSTEKKNVNINLRLHLIKDFFLLVISLYNLLCYLNWFLKLLFLRLAAYSVYFTIMKNNYTKWCLALSQQIY